MDSAGASRTSPRENALQHGPRSRGVLGLLFERETGDREKRVKRFPKDFKFHWQLHRQRIMGRRGSAALPE